MNPKNAQTPHKPWSYGRALYTGFVGTCMTAVLAQPALAADTLWTKASEVMKDVYTQILSISTIAAIVTAAIALLMMNFSRSGRTVDESRAWLKRIIITWIVLNSLGMGSALPALSFADFSSVMLTIIGVCVNGTVALIVLILVLVLAWNYIKLLFAAAERYVMLGVLIFTAPVAFAMGASQATSNIFKSWCRMFGGQVFLLLMNAWCLRLIRQLGSREATAEVFYHILCRRESNERPFDQKAKRVVAEYMTAGRPVDEIPVNEFYAPSRIDLSHGRYICIDGVYYACLLIPSGGYKSQVPAGWLSLLVNAGDGIDLDMFLTRQPKDRMIRKLGQQLRINRSKIKETSDTNTDFDDLDGEVICVPEKTSEYLRNKGYTVKVFNLVTPSCSDSWNCLAEIGGQELMAQLFCDVIIKNTGSGKGDHFWDNAEMNLLKALVLYVERGYPPEKRNIGEVYQLLTHSQEKDLNAMLEILPIDHPAKGPYHIFQQSSESVRGGVIIGLGSRIQVFQNQDIRNITGQENICQGEFHPKDEIPP